MGKTYKDSGVDIQAGDDAVKNIKPIVKDTFRSEVLTGLGHFGAFFDAKFPDYKHPILVSSVDGVGTKLKAAFLTGKHDTVGQCLVNHCCNDILCCGAEPLYFMDYFASGKLETGIMESVVSGFAKACKENNCSIIGGETAEMPSMYQEGEYDISGTIVGVVEFEKIIDGKAIDKGDILLGLPSSGLHTNGYSLARAAMLENHKIDDFIDELGCTIGEELLKIHKSYLKSVKSLADSGLLKGISHITGGGIEGNTNRILPVGRKINVDWQSWKRLPVFDFIQKEGQVDEEEMRHVFNLGIGMILIVDKLDANDILNKLENENPKIIGHVE